jgi:Protein of unknown function (DUF2442)
MEPRIETVEIGESKLVVHLNDGQCLAVAFSEFARLASGTPEQRNNWRLIAGGEGVHWPDLDEDISARGLLKFAS